MSIDSICSHFLKHRKAGLAVLVIRDGKTLHCKGYGVADVETEIEPDAQTIFDLASCTKHFTATAVMMLEERGSLRYDDPLTKFFPDFPDYAREITVRHLLHHTGGLKDYFELYEEDGDDSDRWGESESHTTAEVISALAQEPEPAFPAGERFEYSNSGYVALAGIVEKASGKSFPDFMREEIFRPLEMHRSCVCDGPGAEDDNQAKGYEEDEPFEVTPLDYVYGDGGVRTTLEDLALWDAAMNADELVSEKSRQRAWRSGKLNNGEPTDYGFGWFVGGEEDERWVNHEGSYGGFRTYYTKEADTDLTIIVLCNFSEAEPGDLGEKISEHLAAQAADDEEAEE